VNFDGYTPQSIPRFGSVVQADDVTELPYGIAEDVENCSYRTQSVGPRDGLGLALTFGQGNDLRGVGVLRYLAADNTGQENIQIIAVTKDGNVSSAAPFNQESITSMTAPLVAAGVIRLAPGLYPQLAQAFNKMHIAQGNLMTGQAPSLVVSGALQTCDPISDLPIGNPWEPETFYRVGQIVSPTSGTSSNLYYCTEGGESGSQEPIWPTVEGQTVTDGSGVGNVVWQLINIVCSSGLTPPPAPLLVSATAGALVPAGGTLFLVCTWVNQYGESIANVENLNESIIGSSNSDGTLGNVLEYTNNTGVAVNVNILLPPVPADILALPSQYLPTSVNVYGYLVTSGAPNSTFYLNQTSYALMGSGNPGAAFTASTVPVGQQIPLANTAYTSPVGNVALGVRFMIVLYQSRTGYITGFSGPAPISCNITVDSRKLFVQNLPIGPYNCAGRICAFTVAGAGSAGPYFYIASDDFVSPGDGAANIPQTATYIPDNLTTSAYFDFLDSYLTGASNVTDNFDIIELPPCSDAYFSKALNRVIYTGCVGYPSSCLVSDLEMPETVRVPGSVVDASLTDGDRTVCWRESGTQQIIYKENSAHRVTPNDGDPENWAVNELWRGSGPVGPRAFDYATADGEKLSAYAHRTGGYVWNGGDTPTLVTQDLTGTPDEPGWWDRIHWAYGYLICVTINIRKRLIFFDVPFDGATQNNRRITLDFFYGLDDPIVFIQRTGKEVPNITGRKWSLDAISANQSMYLPQRTSDVTE
jgi:hypothetical protein